MCPSVHAQGGLGSWPPRASERVTLQPLAAPSVRPAAQVRRHDLDVVRGPGAAVRAHRHSPEEPDEPVCHRRRAPAMMSLLHLARLL